MRIRKSLATAILLGLLSTGLPVGAQTAQGTEADAVAQEAAGHPASEESLLHQQSKSTEKEQTEKVKHDAKRLSENTEKPVAKRVQEEIDRLHGDFYSMSQVQSQVLALLSDVVDRLDRLEQREVKTRLAVPGPTTQMLVNPAPAAETNYTQDAVNAQGTSTMTFAYAPNQLYKIYCRRGYLTDISFKKGEAISFVGGGDTAGWAVSQTVVDGVPHLYIKPIVETSTTNLIVTTNKRSYQLILHSSDWYNPMVTWTYGAEDMEQANVQKQQDDALKTAKIAVSDIENLDFSFEVSGKNAEYKPEMVFTDGEKTYLKFKKIPRTQVPLFIQQKGERGMTIVNYRQKDDYYIVNATFQKAQLRVTERESVTIKRKK